MQKPIQPLQRAICVLVIFFILFAQPARAFQEAGITLGPQTETKASFQIAIPETLAGVEEVYAAPPKENPRLVIHIQNIHGNYDAQLQIKNLLSYLYDKYGFSLIFAEGASDKLNADYIRFFPDTARNIELADGLTKKGELTGVEYYLVNAPRNVSVVGIEEADLYRRNYDAFRAVTGEKPLTDSFLSVFDSRLEKLSSKALPIETRRMISEWKKFEAGRREFLPYVKTLAEDARKFIALDLESLFAQVEWPQVTRLLVLQSMQSDLNEPAAQKDKERLVEYLKTKDVSPELIRAIEALGGKRISVSRADTGEKKWEDLPRYLFERLIEEAGPKGFSFSDYPAFSLWAGYLIIQSELDSRALYIEIERVFQRILDELAVKQSEKNLIELYRDQDLLQKLLHLELSRKEWERAQYRRDWIKPQAMMSRLKKIDEQIKNPKDDIPVVLPEQDSRAELTGKSAKISQIFDTAFQFYDYARQRESIFYKTIDQKMTEEKKDKAVLVTGGFHTEGLMEIFHDEEVNYAVLMPKLAGANLDNKNYISSMMQSGQTMFDLATLEKVLLAQKSELREKQGMDGAHAVKLLVQGIIETNLRSGNPLGDKAIIQAYNQSPFAQDMQSELRLTPQGDAARLYLNGKPMLTPSGQQLAVAVEGGIPVDHAMSIPPEKGAAVRIPTVGNPIADAPTISLAPIAPERSELREIDPASQLARMRELENKIIIENLPERLRSAGLKPPDWKAMAPSASPPEIAAALSYGLFDLSDTPAGKAQEVLTHFADASARVPYLSALADAMKQFPALSISDKPGALVIVTGEPPEREALTALRAQLLTQQKQFVRIAIPASKLTDAQEAELTSLYNEIFAPYEKEIGLRFSIKKVNNAEAVRQGLMSSIHNAMNKLGIHDYDKDHFVQWIDDSAKDGFKNAENLENMTGNVMRSEFEGQALYQGLVFGVGSLAAMKLSQGLSASELDELTAGGLKQQGRIIHFQATPGLLSLVNGFMQALQADLKIKSSA